MHRADMDALEDSLANREALEGLQTLLMKSGSESLGSC